MAKTTTTASRRTNSRQQLNNASSLLLISFLVVVISVIIPQSSFAFIAVVPPPVAARRLPSSALAKKSSLPSSNNDWNCRFRKPNTPFSTTRSGGGSLSRVGDNCGRRGTTTTSMNLFFRGGAAAAVAENTGAANLIGSFIESLGSSPTRVFNTLLVSLVIGAIGFRFGGQQKNDDGSNNTQKEKDTGGKSLQLRFLPVFYLLRMADWLQGPYFYEVYASKIIAGTSVSMSLISNLFLTGFASTALFGPFVGKMADTKGRKRGTLAFAAFYILGALSTRSTVLQWLFLGRIMSGIGTSLLFSAPESWLVGEAQREGKEQYLGETFGLAYSGDSIVAIAAGQLAALAASKRGPTGPFELSVGFLLVGAALAGLTWKENIAPQQSSSSSSSSTETSGTSGKKEKNKKPSIVDALKLIASDQKIALVGLTQSLFEAAMYIFVLQWPPALSKAVGKFFNGNAATPYGTVFSCFMACCLVGSTAFGKLAAKEEKGPNEAPMETGMALMLLLGTLAMGTAATVATNGGLASINPLISLVSAFFLFEGCVGFYFPSIGTLRSKYVPDSHRSVIMNLFGIPLNVLVVTVFLSIKKLGVGGALSVSTTALGVATICMAKLRQIAKRGTTEDDELVAAVA